MNQNEAIEELQRKNSLLKLHLIYISGISFACICLVIVLNFCEDSMFKNCISVSSTVASIILSVIAIILSVTGERTTNEIRNKVSDSVEKLEDCTDKSNHLSLELAETLQQLNTLYENMNDKVVTQIPEIKESINSLIQHNIVNNEDTNKILDNVMEYLKRISPDLRLSIKTALLFILECSDQSKLTINDVCQYLCEKGYNSQTASLSTGFIMGCLSTKTLNSDSINKLIESI